MTTNNHTYQHILVAVDFTADSRLICQRALSIAAANDARMTLVHVVEYVPLDLSNDLMLAQPVDVDEQMVEEAKKQLAEIATECDCAAVNQLTEVGSTKAEILRVAEELAADLIIVGSHTRHGLALLLGSTAKAVLNGAPCDVLAVRVPD